MIFVSNHVDQLSKYADSTKTLLVSPLSNGTCEPFAHTPKTRPFPCQPGRQATRPPCAYVHLQATQRLQRKQPWILLVKKHIPWDPWDWYMYLTWKPYRNQPYNVGKYTYIHGWYGNQWVCVLANQWMHAPQTTKARTPSKRSTAPSSQSFAPAMHWFPSACKVPCLSSSWVTSLSSCDMANHGNSPWKYPHNGDPAQKNPNRPSLPTS